MKSPGCQKNAAHGGYILMEVMLATTIFAMVAVALAIALNETIEAAMRLQRETKIIWNLESKLNESRLGRLVLGKKTSPPDAAGVSYESEISMLNLKNNKNQSLTGLYSIKITAHWKEQNQDAEEVSQTYVYQQ